MSSVPSRKKQALRPRFTPRMPHSEENETGLLYGVIIKLRVRQLLYKSMSFMPRLNIDNNLHSFEYDVTVMSRVKSALDY